MKQRRLLVYTFLPLKVRKTLPFTTPQQEIMQSRPVLSITYRESACVLSSSLKALFSAIYASNICYSHATRSRDTAISIHIAPTGNNSHGKRVPEVKVFIENFPSSLVNSRHTKLFPTPRPTARHHAQLLPSAGKTQLLAAAPGAPTFCFC